LGRPEKGRDRYHVFVNLVKRPGRGARNVGVGWKQSRRRRMGGGGRKEHVIYFSILTWELHLP